MTRIAFVDPSHGAAGDMLLSALLDAGAPAAVLQRTVDALGLDDVRVDVSEVTRAGIRALHVDVQPALRTRERRAPELRAVVDGARDLPDRVREPSLAILDRLIAAEGGVHGVAPLDVVLHELGGDDTIVDICGVVGLLDALGVEHIACGPLPMPTVGGATIASAHGALPIPAPATLALAAGVPVVGVDGAAELVTPTAAAIVTTLAHQWGAMPAMTIDALGTGAGARDDVDRPNVCRVAIGSAASVDEGIDHVVQLEANVDDMVPELVPDVLAACLAAGALDAWAEPIHMKKGRPGFVLAVLARAQDQQLLAETLLRHSTTLGVRVLPVSRHVADRAVREVTVDGHVVRVKLGIVGGEVLNIAPEHDDCAAVAAQLGRPVKQVWAEALAAAVADVRAAREEHDALPR